MRYTVFLLFSFFVFKGPMTFAQGFYDLNTIQTIEITFAQSNWDQLLDAAYTGAAITSWRRASPSTGRSSTALG